MHPEFEVGREGRRGRGSCILRVDRLESVRFVAVGQLAVAQADDGKAFRRSHPRPMPPVAADRPARDVVNAVIVDDFIDVGVSLKNREHVVLLKEGQDFVSIGDDELRMHGWRCRA